jgi:hypothetical protein
MSGDAMMAWGEGVGSERAAPLIRKPEVSGQPVAPAALLRGKYPRHPSEGGWAPEPVWTFGEERILLHTCGGRHTE